MPDSQSRTPRHPLFYASLGFSAGILVGTHLWRPTTWWLAAFAFSAGAALYFARVRPRIAPVVSLVALVFAGALVLQIRQPENQSHRAILTLADGRELTITAHVTGEAFPRDDGFRGTRQSLELETEEVLKSAGQAAAPFIGA